MTCPSKQIENLYKKKVEEKCSIPDTTINYTAIMFETVLEWLDEKFEKHEIGCSCPEKSEDD